MDENEKLDLIATGMWSYNGHPVISTLAASIGNAAKDAEVADASRLRALVEILGGLWEYEDARLRGWSYLGPMDFLRMLESAAERGGCERDLAAALVEAAKRKAELEPEDYMPDPEHAKMIEWELDECPWCQAAIPEPPMTRDAMLGLTPPDDLSMMGKCKSCEGELQTAEALTLRIFARGRKLGIEPRPLQEYLTGGDPQWCIVAATLVTAGQTVDSPVINHSMRDDGSLVCSVLQAGGEYVDNFYINSADGPAPYHVIGIPREVEGEAKAVAAEALKTAGR